GPDTRLRAACDWLYRSGTRSHRGPPAWAAPERPRARSLSGVRGLWVKLIWPSTPRLVGNLHVTDVDDPGRAPIEHERDRSEVGQLEAKVGEPGQLEPQRLHHDLSSAKRDVRIEKAVDRARRNRRRRGGGCPLEGEVLIGVPGVLRLGGWPDARGQHFAAFGEEGCGVELQCDTRAECAPFEPQRDRGLRTAGVDQILELTCGG